jgi:hypothetical protein
VRLVLVEDAEMLRRYAARIDVRNGKQVRVLAVLSGRGYKNLVSVRQLRKIASAGGKARWANKTKKQRAQWARHANAVRWERVKAAAKG